MQHSRGFSLFELMIAMAIVAILASLMFSSYYSHIRKSRRVEAMQTLMAMQLEQERYRSSNPQYGTLSNIWGGNTSSDGGNYSLSISNLSANTYTLTATAVGDQANDGENGTACSPMTITMSSGTETRTPAACWTK